MLRHFIRAARLYTLQNTTHDGCWARRGVRKTVGDERPRETSKRMKRALKWNRTCYCLPSMRASPACIYALYAFAATSNSMASKRTHAGVFKPHRADARQLAAKNVVGSRILAYA